jgi:glutaredoxin
MTLSALILILNDSKCTHCTDAAFVWDNLGLLVKTIDITLEDGKTLRIDIVAT